MNRYIATVNSRGATATRNAAFRKTKIALQFSLNHKLLLVLRDHHRVAFESGGQVVGLSFVQDPGTGKILLGCCDTPGAEAE